MTQQATRRAPARRLFSLLMFLGCAGPGLGSPVGLAPASGPAMLPAVIAQGSAAGELLIAVVLALAAVATAVGVRLARRSH